MSYLVMAQAMAPYGEPGEAVRAAFPFEKYPPFFPLLLAVTGGAYYWPAAHALVAVSFGVGVFLLALHVGRIAGSGAIGIVAAGAFAAMPGAWLQMKGILSEFPYIALSLAALLVHGGFRSRTVPLRGAIVLGLLLAAVLLTRTIGVALIAAIVFAELLRWLRTGERGRVQALWPALAIALAAAAAWYALRPSGGEDEYVLRSAGVAREVAQHGVAALAQLVSSNASAICDAWLNALLIYWGEPWQPRFLLAAALGLAGLGASAWRAWNGEADGAYCLAFLAILLAWPFPGQMYRLAFPVAPLLLGLAFWAIGALLHRTRGELDGRGPAIGLGAISMAICIPAMLYVVERARSVEPSAAGRRLATIAEFYRIPHRPSAERNAAVQLAVFDDLGRIRASTPEGARVMWYMPGYVALLANRHGVHLDIPADSRDLVAQVRAGKPDFLYFANVHPRDSAQRHGNPVAPWADAREYADVVWARRDRTTGEPLAVLMRLDPARLARAAQ